MKDRRVKRKMRETVKSESGESKRGQIKRTTKHMMTWRDARKTPWALSQCHVRHWNVCCETRENVTCEGVLTTHSAGCSRLLSAVKRSDYNNSKNLVKKFHSEFLDEWASKTILLFFEAAHSMSSEVVDNLWFMSSTSVHSTATMWYWMKKTTNATFGIDKGELVQVALLQIHSGDGAYL